MPNQLLKSSFTNRSSTLIACIGLTTLASLAHAGDTYQEVMETLLTVQGQDMIVLGLNSGADPASAFQFTTVVNTDNRTFSFSTAAGSTYNGQSLSLAGSGGYDPGTGAYSWDFTGANGATSWDVAGGGTWVGDPNLPFTAVGTIAGPPPVPVVLTGTTSYNVATGTSTYTGTANIGGKVYGPLTGSDAKVGNQWKWNLIIPKAPTGIILSITGAQASNGGTTIGSFTGGVAAVPEPASYATMGLGILGLLGLRRRVRR